MKKTKVKKSRKMTARKRAIKMADDAMSKYVRARDKRCVICGRTTNLTAGHLITRAKYSVRWDEDNVFCQCMGCNLKHEYYPEAFTYWFLGRFGEEKYNELVHKSNSIKKYTTEEILLIADRYKTKLKELEEKNEQGKN